MDSHASGPAVPKNSDNEDRDEKQTTIHEWLDKCAPPLEGEASPDGFNADDYMDYIKELELSDEDAKELLTILWNIMSHFVNLGFGVDAASIMAAVTKPTHCGKKTSDSRPDSDDLVD
jgi:homoserine acetyltransferase